MDILKVLDVPCRGDETQKQGEETTKEQLRGPVYWRTVERLEGREEGRIGEGGMAIDDVCSASAKESGGIRSGQNRSVKSSFLHIKHIRKFKRRKPKLGGILPVGIGPHEESSTFSP